MLTFRNTILCYLTSPLDTLSTKCSLPSFSLTRKHTRSGGASVNNANTILNFCKNEAGTHHCWIARPQSRQGSCWESVLSPLHCLMWWASEVLMKLLERGPHATLPGRQVSPPGWRCMEHVTRCLVNMSCENLSKWNQLFFCLPTSFWRTYAGRMPRVRFSSRRCHIGWCQGVGGQEPP